MEAEQWSAAEVVVKGGCYQVTDVTQQKPFFEKLPSTIFYAALDALSSKQVLEGAPEALEAAEQLHLLAEFLGARLADW